MRAASNLEIAMRMTAYIGTILAALSLTAPAVSAASGPDAADLAVCAFLASTPPRETSAYLVKAAVFDLDGDRTPERLSIEDEGTMHIDQYRVARMDGSEVSIGAPTVDDDDWGWSMSKRWLIQAGRAYVLRFAGWDTGYLRFVSRIGSDRVEEPLCKFEPQIDIALTARAPGDGDLCKAVAEHQLKYETAQPFAEPKEAAGHDLVAGKASMTAKLRVDFANDGKPADVYLYEVDSSAGPGCSLKYYDTAPNDTSSRHHTQLTTMQGLDLTDAYTRRTCEDLEPRWFTFNGLRYLETQSSEAQAPKNERGEYHFVDLIEHGRPRRACEATYSHKPPKLTGAWDVTSWAAPPAPH
jgi:hypothetical protein